ITITGTGGTGLSGSAGVRMDKSTADISSVDGNIAITGTATAGTGTFQDGVREINGAGIHVTGTGSLTITGTAGSTDATVGLALRLASGNVPNTSFNAPQINLVGDRISI